MSRPVNNFNYRLLVPSGLAEKLSTAVLYRPVPSRKYAPTVPSRRRNLTLLSHPSIAVTPSCRHTVNTNTGTSSARQSWQSDNSSCDGRSSRLEKIPGVKVGFNRTPTCSVAMLVRYNFMFLWTCEDIRFFPLFTTILSLLHHQWSSLDTSVSPLQFSSQRQSLDTVHMIYCTQTINYFHGIHSVAVLVDTVQASSEWN